MPATRRRPRSEPVDSSRAVGALLPPVGRPERGVSLRQTPGGPVMDLERYVPGLLTLVTSQLSGGASAAYLSLYAVGIETWRVMVMLAIEGRITVQRMAQLIDADKGAISRTLKAMREQGLLRFEPDLHDRRVRHAVMTPRGRALHDRIIHLALLREQTALSVLDKSEVAMLRDMLRRIYVNLPAVETATQAFIRREREALGMEPDGPALRRRGRAATSPAAKSRS